MLLPADPVRWAPVQRLLVDLLSSGLNVSGNSQDQHSGATASDTFTSRAELIIRSFGGLARQLANFQSADALQHEGSSILTLDTESPLACSRSHRRTKRRRSSINCISVDHPEFVYYDLFKEIIAGLCQIALANQLSHSVIGAACVQVSQSTFTLNQSSSTSLAIVFVLWLKKDTDQTI